jgi:hypothetical protein
MKGSSIMLFEYMTMVGIPLLLFLAVILSPISGAQIIRRALLALIGIASVVFGTVALVDVYYRGAKKNE